jgi:hypothetical protein
MNWERSKKGKLSCKSTRGNREHLSGAHEEKALQEEGNWQHIGCREQLFSAVLLVASSTSSTIVRVHRLVPSRPMPYEWRSSPPQKLPRTRGSRMHARHRESCQRACTSVEHLRWAVGAFCQQSQPKGAFSFLCDSCFLNFFLASKICI